MTAPHPQRSIEESLSIEPAAQFDPAAQPTYEREGRSFEDTYVGPPLLGRDEALVTTLPIRRVQSSIPRLGTQLRRAEEEARIAGLPSAFSAQAAYQSSHFFTGPGTISGPIAYGTLPTASIARPRRRIRPGLVLLRLFVGVLVITLGAAIGGYLYLRSHPAKFVTLRRVVNPFATPSSSSSASNRPQAATATKRGSVSHGSFVPVAQGSATTTYQLPVKSYSVQVSIDHPCWMTVQSPIGGHYLFASVIQPSASPKTVPVQGSSSVMVAAATHYLRVVSGKRLLGTIARPVVGHHYIFLTAKH